MNLIPKVVDQLTAEFARLPGIGPKTAQRLTFYCLMATGEQPERLADALRGVRGAVHPCATCFFIAEDTECAICRDPRRDRSTICVVEEAVDVLAVERSGEYRGVYHVLEGALSPIDGVGPDQLRVRELETRAASPDVTEVVLATDPDVEGEATAHYVAERLRSLVGQVTRLAHGLPAGADLQYADELTVARAYSGRRAL